MSDQEEEEFDYHEATIAEGDDRDLGTDETPRIPDLRSSDDEHVSILPRNRTYLNDRYVVPTHENSNYGVAIIGEDNRELMANSLAAPSSKTLQ